MSCKITIGGKTYTSDSNCQSICVMNGEVIIGGKSVCKNVTSIVHIEGNTESVKCDGDIKIFGCVNGNVHSGGSCECDDVMGSVDCGGSCNCGNVGKNVDAGGSVSAKNISGTVDAGGSVRCNKN